MSFIINSFVINRSKENAITQLFMEGNYLSINFLEHNLIPSPIFSNNYLTKLNNQISSQNSPNKSAYKSPNFPSIEKHTLKSKFMVPNCKAKIICFKLY